MSENDIAFTQAECDAAFRLAEEFIHCYFDLINKRVNCDMSRFCGYEKFAEYIENNFHYLDMWNKTVFRDDEPQDYEIECTLKEKLNLGGSVMLDIVIEELNGSGRGAFQQLFIISKIDGEYKIVDWLDPYYNTVRYGAFKLRHTDYWADGSLIADHILERQREHNNKRIALWLENENMTYEDIGIEEPVEACIEEKE